MDTRVPLIVQQVVGGESLESVCAQYSLFVAHYDGLTMLCYDNVKTPRNELTSEARGLVLDSDLRAECWPMNRFYNHGEDTVHRVQRPLRVEEKEDGTLLHLFYSTSCSRWMATTRHTFCEQDIMYQEILLDALGAESLCDFADGVLDRRYTYCCEVCSLRNRILRVYPNPVCFLLAAYCTGTHVSLSNEELDELAEKCTFSRPRVYPGETIEDAEKQLELCCEAEVLFEGFVIKGSAGGRLKIKSKLYKSIHKFAYRGFSRATPFFIVPWINSGKAEMLLDVLKDLRKDDWLEFKRRIDLYRGIIEREIASLWRLWIDVISVEEDKKNRWAQCNASEAPCADLLLKEHDNLMVAQDIDAALHAAFIKWQSWVMKHLFPDQDDAHSYFLSKTHPQKYCEPEAPTVAGVATVAPTKAPEGHWVTYCSCGALMECLRLKQDRIRYTECHCGQLFGVKTYKTGFLLWVCRVCGADHEAHQTDGSWEPAGKVFEAGQPLGLPASIATKRLRLQVHQLMRGKWSRDEACQFIADGLGMTRQQVHMSSFDAFQCFDAIQLF